MLAGLTTTVPADYVTWAVIGSFAGLIDGNRGRLKGIVQELCESRGGRPELSVLTSLLASVDVKIY